MARGWESKSVEEQQESVVVDTRAVKPPITAEQAAQTTKLATLNLARTRAVADLEAATAPAHRRMLEQMIADLDRLLAASR